MEEIEFLNIFPTEIYLRIFSYLDPIVLCSTVSLTCKYFNKLIDDKRLWQNFANKRWAYQRIPSKFKENKNPLKKYCMDRYIKETNLNRIASISMKGELIIHDEEGKNSVKLSKKARQPCFSPNCYWIAFVDLERDLGEPPRLVVCRPDGTRRREKKLEYFPFYVYWSSDSSRVSFLGNANLSSDRCIGLDIWDIEEEKVGRVGYARPFFYYFCEDKDILISHENSESFKIYDCSLFPSPLFLKDVPSYDSVAYHSAPIRTKDGKKYIWGTSNGEKIELRISTSDTLETIDLVCQNENESHSFLLCPDDNHLAYTVRDVLGRQTLVVGDLYLFNMQDKKKIKINDNIIAYFFSGNGRYLLILTSIEQKMMWKVYDIKNGKLIEFPKSMFSPSSSFLREFLFFFDQYALSHSLFSPDSSSFIFCGYIEDDLCLYRQIIDPDNDEQPMCVKVPGQSSLLAFYSKR